MAQSDEPLGCLLVPIFIAVGAWLAFSNGSWSNSLWYAARYHVGFGDVQTDAKPGDCDFLHAPLGSKGCSYKAHVKVLNAGAQKCPSVLGQRVAICTHRLIAAAAVLAALARRGVPDLP